MDEPIAEARPDGRWRLVREGAVVTAGNLATIAARLVGLRLLTEVVDPAVFGEANLLVGLVTLGTALLCVPALQGVLRYYPEARDRGRVAELQRISQRLLVPGTAALCVVLLAGGAIWAWLNPSGPSVAAFALLAALAVADVRRLYESAQLNAARQQGLYSLWTAADAWVRPLAAVVAALLLAPATSPVLLGFAIGAFAVNETLVRFVKRPPPSAAPDPVWEARLRADLGRFMTPLVPLALLGWIATLSDRYILAGLAGAATTGLYVAAYGLASQPFITVANIGVAVFRPILFESFARGEARKTRRTLWTWLGSMTAVYAVGWTALWLFAEPIVRLLLAEEYRGGAALLPWIGAAYAWQGYQYLFETTIYARAATKRLLVLQVVGALTSFTLYWGLIPRYGAMGAAIAIFCSLGVTCGMAVGLSGAGGLLLVRREEEDKTKN